MVRLNRTYYSLQKVQNISFKTWYCLTVHIIRFQNLQAKFFKNCPVKSKFQQITQIPRSSPTQSTNYAKLAHFVNIFYLCFRHLPRQRTLQKPSELRKFRAIRPHSPQITQNSHNLFTLYITFQMPDQWQGTP